jgi:ketopantoate reductase
MRILVVGAGSVGGYFGGRMLEAGRDVTFLVRPRRAAELARTGLVIRSQQGNVEIPAPPTIATEMLREPFDLILVSCKAYDLAGAADSFAAAVGPKTAILPLLNGMRATIGDIVAAGATDVVEQILNECAAIAAGQGFPPATSSIQRSRAVFTKPGSELTASMFRDIERGGPIEADHIIGDLLRRRDSRRPGGEQANSSPLLRIVYAHLKAYEARREREVVQRGGAGFPQ